MLVRGGFLLALLAVLVSIGAGFTVVTVRHRADEHDARSAVALAHRVPSPPDAIASTECRGDGLVSCWTSPQAAPPVARAVTASLARTGARPSMQCHQQPAGVPPETAAAAWCQVSVFIGSHALTVFATPHATRTASGPKLDGTLVSVSAS